MLIRCEAAIEYIIELDNDIINSTQYISALNDDRIDCVNLTFLISKVLFHLLLASSLTNMQEPGDMLVQKLKNYESAPQQRVNHPFTELYLC